MNYLKIIDGDGKTLAILNNATNTVIREKLNGEYTFSFDVFQEELKTEYLHDENNLIEIDNNLFQVARYKETHDFNNKVVYNVECEQISYKLIEDKLLMYSALGTPTVILNNLLKNTDFSIDTVEIDNADAVTIENETDKREILAEIQNVFGGEYKFDRYKISLLNQRGQNKGVQFRIGKNIKGISRIVDRTKRDEKGNPCILYEINIVELNDLKEFKRLEYFELGDTVKIIDDKLNIKILARIVELEYNPLKRINTRVVLGNFIEDLATNNLKVTRTINYAFKDKKLNSAVLKGITIVNENTGNKSFEVTEDGQVNVENALKADKIYAENIDTTNALISSAQIENLVVGSNVTMGANATIGWGNVDNKPNDLAYQDDIPIIPSYIKSTRITETTIESPTITGATINGGIINVATDINVGDAIYVGSLNSGRAKGIHLSNNTYISKNTRDDDLDDLGIYSDRISISGHSNVAIGGQNFDLNSMNAYYHNSEIATMSDLNYYATESYVDRAIDNIDTNSYYEGSGIDISGHRISVDFGVVATKDNVNDLQHYIEANFVKK